jgi:hypothetical protein
MRNFRKGFRFPNGIPRVMSDKPADTDIAAGTVAHNSDLRDRIAASVCNWYYNETTAWEETSEPSRQDWLGCAEAVIASLNLRTDQVGTLTRYVTEWETNG